jgi:hypothetical protein
MPQPTPSDVHVNGPLTTISIAFIQDAAEFIAGKMFPDVRVMKQSDVYYEFDKYAWFTSQARKRAPGSPTAGSGFTLNADSTYFCAVTGFHKDLDGQTRGNADPQINLDQVATEFVTRQLLLEKETDWASKYFTTGVWTGSSTGTDVTPATAWDLVGSTPIEDMRAELLAVKSNTGFRPNKICMGEEVWNVLQDHPDFLERIKYTERAIVVPALLAAVLGVDEVLIGGAVQNTGNEGAALSMGFIFGDAVLLAYAAPRPALMMPTAGYTFLWSQFTGSQGSGTRVKRFRMEELDSDRIEGESSYDHKVVAPELGAFLTNVLS